MPKSRPSPEDRKRDRAVEAALEGIDKKYRTRKGKQIEALLDQLEKDAPGTLDRLRREAANSKPPKKAGSKPIYSGSWRSFEQEFASDWWKALKKPWICAKCGKQIDPAGKGDAAPSIDHINPWATIKTTIPTATVCTGTYHWEVAYTADVRAAFQDVSNLQPMHQGCNSAKNGPKNTNSIAPQRKGACPGNAICQEVKAE